MSNVEACESPALDSLARSLPADRLPDLLADLARAQAIALARLVTPTSINKNLEPEPCLLTVDDAPKLVSLTPIALRRSARFRSARRKLGERSLRFDRAALLRVIGRAA
jgi:hypothetical protein